MNMSYIILKHVIWRFQIYNLFLEIFNFREDKSNYVFREILKCFRKTTKFEFFAKQIIYLNYIIYIYIYIYILNYNYIEK